MVQKPSKNLCFLRYLLFVIAIPFAEPGGSRSPQLDAKAIAEGALFTPLRFGFLDGASKSSCKAEVWPQIRGNFSTTRSPHSPQGLRRAKTEITFHVLAGWRGCPTGIAAETAASTTSSVPSV